MCLGPLGRRDALNRPEGGKSSRHQGERAALPRRSRPVPVSLVLGPSPLQVLTALDRDVSCRKHKLRQKLEQIISLMCSNS